MAKYVCSVCGFVYDEAKEGMWSALPDDWVCPLCKASRSAFQRQDEVKNETAVTEKIEVYAYRGLSALQMSALCSNLAKGCEKQDLLEEMNQYMALAEFFKKGMTESENGDVAKLLDWVNEDLASYFPMVKQTAESYQDRGALRALTWSEKVSYLLSSLLERYQKEGDAWLEKTNIYVCSICGFIYVGDDLPEVCPVCKVPNWKFEKVVEVSVDE